MPFYEYICPECKNEETIQMTLAEYDDLQAVAHVLETSGVFCANEDPKEHFPDRPAMRRKFSPPGIQIN